MDEYIFSAVRTLSEGEKPKLEIVIENPRVGLLSALRKQWCWFSWDSNWGGTADVVPMFFGRVVGIPADMQAETITVTFIAWPSNYKKQLQTLAETLKVLPFFDPVFTDVARRDDPMAIFESQSKMVVVDPVTHVVSASDVLDAEDGNVDLTLDDHFYDSMRIAPGSVPKTAIHVDASVRWTQTAAGFFNMPGTVFDSLNGDGVLADWPKPGQQLAPGLTVYSSGAVDKNNTDGIEMETVTSNWTNKEKHHEDGDTLSSSWSWTTPGGGPPGYFAAADSFTYQPGFLDPFAVDGDGDISPTNIPMSLNATFTYIMPYNIDTGALTIEYRAARPHTERIVFTLFANVQPTTLDPLVSEDSETIVISGSDVSIPIIDLLNWTTISGTFVDVGTVIFPDDPQIPSAKTAQVCTVAGTTGLVEPEFSDVYGETTVDGTATWASLGIATPTESAPDWTTVSNVPTGTMVLPRRPLFILEAEFLKANPSGLGSEGEIVLLPSGVYQQSIDGIWTDIGTELPDGVTYYIATTGGTTGDVLPVFNSTLHDTTTDGTVVWTSIGAGVIPIGGTPGNVTASTYFGQDLGRPSLEHLIMRARARLRYASRCVSATFTCSYLKGTELTLRKSVTLHDYRLPGGLILGKVTGVQHVAHCAST